MCCEGKGRPDLCIRLFGQQLHAKFFQFWLLPLNSVEHFKATSFWDFPGGPGVKNPPCKAGVEVWIPGQGPKIPRDWEKLSSHTATRGPVRHSERPWSRSPPCDEGIVRQLFLREIMSNLSPSDRY